MAVRTALLAAAVLALGAPAAQALPGPAGSDDASIAQYGYSVTEPPPETPPTTTPPETPSITSPDIEVKPEAPAGGAGGSGSGGPTERVVAERGSGGGPVVSGDALPFTGSDLLVLVVLGSLLVAGGAALRRVLRATPA